VLILCPTHRVAIRAWRCRQPSLHHTPGCRGGGPGCLAASAGDARRHRG
jgi:hypothetical protein